jgi:hypothetical protein
VNVENSIDLSVMRWAIDETSNLEFTQALLPELEAKYEIDTALNRILEVLANQP